MACLDIFTHGTEIFIIPCCDSNDIYHVSSFNVLKAYKAMGCQSSSKYQPYSAINSQEQRVLALRNNDVAVLLAHR